MTIWGEKQTAKYVDRILFSPSLEKDDLLAEATTRDY
jgi:hypothetical protein